MAGLLRAYVDEFNDYRDEACQAFGMAGLIGPVHEWHKLQCKWEDALECCGVKRFHATDLQSLEGEFKGWTNSQRERLMSLLVSIIQHSLGNFRLLGSAIAMSSYKYLPEYRRRHLRNPYFLSALSVLSDATRFAHYEFNHKPVEFVFDQKMKHKHLIDAAYEQVLITKWGSLCASNSMASHKEITPVQVADLFAYESKKHIESRLAIADATDLRWPVEQLKQLFVEGESTLFNWHGLMLVTDLWGNYHRACEHILKIKTTETVLERKERLRAAKKDL